LVRKCLGQHEIATVQATTIDADSGLIRLTTTLVHASGEWVSSEWPVCPTSETVAPQRLGAALTYARRYALFTLVGIAGEDDLDAPDLPTAGLSPEAQANSLESEKESGAFDHSPPSQAVGRSLRGTERRAPAQRPKAPKLSPSASDHLRQRLMSELERLHEPEALAGWAHRALPLKDQLSAADAQAVEAAFAVRLAQLGEAAHDVEATNQKANGQNGQPVPTEPGAATVSVIRKPVRDRDRDGRHGQLQCTNGRRARTRLEIGKSVMAATPRHRDRERPLQNPGKASAAIPATTASSARNTEHF